MIRATLNAARVKSALLPSRVLSGTASDPSENLTPLISFTIRKDVKGTLH